MATAQPYKDRTLIASICDEDSITGLLLAGTGHVNESGSKNFVTVDNKTPTSTIEAAFESFTERNDVAIVLINQHIADKIRASIEAYTLPFPAVLEIPSKEHPYDPEKDSVLKKVRKLFGE